MVLQKGVVMGATETVRAAVPTTPRGWILAIGAIVGVLAIIVGGTWLLATASDSPTAAPAPASTTADAVPSPTAPAPQVGANPGCSAIGRATNTWQDGFQYDVSVTAVDADITAWRVTLELGDAQVRDAWNVSVQTSDSTPALAANVDYNGTLSAGQSTTFGFTAAGEAPPESELMCEATVAVVVTPGPAESAEGDRPASGGAVPPVSNANSGDDWLSTDGNLIVDSDGNRVWLTGANWFGFNTEERVFHGLSTANLDDLVDGIAERGINVIRVPISTELLLEWKDGKAQVSGAVNKALNASLADATSLQVFDAFLVSAKARGVKVILDVHSAKADNAGHLAPLWFVEDITVNDFYEGWEWVATRYRGDDTIVGFDLKNEPHGQPSENSRATWDGSTSAHNWRHVAEQAAARIQAVHPDALIFVEGVEATPKPGKTNASTNNADYDFNWWGGNLRLADTFPVRLDVSNKLVYSPHEYGPLVFEQPWFQGPFTAASLERDVWAPNWLYLHDEGTSPLLIGEWGGRLGQDPRQDAWMTALRDLIVDRELHHTFWCINPNSGDTGGLLLDDWQTWDETKYALLEPALWQDSRGRFVSLDHQVPLPGGITVTEFYAD
jgi:endoglucanase